MRPEILAIINDNKSKIGDSYAVLDDDFVALADDLARFFEEEQGNRIMPQPLEPEKFNNSRLYYESPNRAERNQKILNLIGRFLMIALLLGLITFLVTRCSVYKPVQEERAIYDGKDVYWENSRGKVYKLTWGDIKVLGIDSVRTYYLEHNAEQ